MALPLDLSSLPTYGEIVATVALGTALLTSLGGYLDRLKIKARAIVAAEDSFERVKVANARIESVEADLASHKLNIANNYIDADKLASTERRLFEAIGGVTVALRDVTHRLDRVLDNRAHGATG